MTMLVVVLALLFTACSTGLVATSLPQGPFESPGDSAAAASSDAGSAATSGPAGEGASTN